MVELLSPAGDFECIKAAVQNGANAIYFGANSFSARAFAHNFNDEMLEKAINYCKTRLVKTNLTINILLKDDEYIEALELAKRAYSFGIDAIIVQDLGFAKKLIAEFPNLDIHASTQLSIHNLQGAIEAKKLGFKRVVLSRELSIDEIEYICKNVDIEIECFIHGALCVSYSGQCLFSSLIGGRSGNRGKCAGTCRMKYDLIDDENNSIDNGYLLSSRDLCSLEYIKRLIEAGVTCFKIEGRMKSFEYVSTVTRIYRKYMDLANSDDNYIIDENDKKDLMQVFNRGSFSTGHLNSKPNLNLIYKEKPNHMGLPLGIVEKYNRQKGYITLKTSERIDTLDSIALEHETGLYTISELMQQEKNIKSSNPGNIITIGRMKGNINLGDKVFKMVSKRLFNLASQSIEYEKIKIPFSISMTIKLDEPVTIVVTSLSKSNIYSDININITSDIIPIEAKNRPITKQNIITSMNKTTDTPFVFSNFNIQLDDNVFIPKISMLNALRRDIIQKIENHITSCSAHDTKNIKFNNLALNFESSKPIISNSNTNITVLLNILDIEQDYTKLKNIDNLYIPLKYFMDTKYFKTLKILTTNFNVYIYIPTIIKSNYRNIFYEHLENSLKTYKIEGLVISNISSLHTLTELSKAGINLSKLKIIANYTFNVLNKHSIKVLKSLNINRFTYSPEIDKPALIDLTTLNLIEDELIVYGHAPVLNMSFCPLGKSNKCYPSCTRKCMDGHKYYLKDRLNLDFLIIPDNIQTTTTVYNSKITSLSINDFNISSARIDILFETIDEINTIISTVKSGNRLIGFQYTNANLNRII